MLNLTFDLIVRYTIFVIIVLFIIKTIFFFKWRSAGWGISHFIFFNGANIMMTDSYERQAMKRKQNTLTVFLLLFGILQALIWIFIN